ncbi:MAG: hypothetical protein PHW52_04205 [Candidatus Pacebacteria bacterium]|nr:hypothetical protein [Candidatus Paceibacterota bacterium]
MKILFVSAEIMAGDLAYRLKEEGNDVKLYIEHPGDYDCFENMIEKTLDWRKEIDWVTKDGLIIFDDIGYGKEQDDLRRSGYNVFGGCEDGDRLELDREHAQKVFAGCGMSTTETLNFDNLEDAIKHIKKNKTAYAVKQNDHNSSLCFIGNMSDGSDCIELLESYKTIGKNFSVTLQKKLNGIEVGVARYFNGIDWVGPIEMNVEHKRFMNDDVGPLTGEMGTVMWYQDEENRIFQSTLKKLKPYLQEIGYKGDVDIDCMVDQDEIYPIEATMRLGSPAIYSQIEIHNSRWTDFLLSIAKGVPFELDYKKGFSLVITIGIPPFPYRFESISGYLKGVPIYLKEFSKDDMSHLHFEEVRLDKNRYVVAGEEGHIVYVTSIDSNIDSAREKVYNLVSKITIPKMMYRTDIGIRFMKDYNQLKKWNWI